MTHPSDETLAQMAHGGLHGADLEALEAHLDGCAACRSLMAAVTNGSAPYAPRERASLAAGERLGRYEIESLIGAGGMGMVYAARDTQLNRRAVLKLMRPAFGGELGRVRLLREAQAMASLSHPNVVHVYELGESGERVFVAMELVEGGTLRDWMKSPGSWKDVVAMMVQAGRGLAAAHEAGVIHRDFKPENVLVGKDGRPRVGDFGLARPELVAEEELPKNASLRVTRTGTMLGTPAYMSPEQLAGKPADARSDQYSFCVTLYEALTGKRPFPADTLEELRARVSGGMPPPPADGPTPAAVWAVIARGLHPDPAERFPSMDALLLLLGAPVPAVAAPAGRYWPRVMRAGLVAALVSASGAGVAAWLWGARPAAPVAAPAVSLPAVIHLESGQDARFDLPGIRQVHATGGALRSYEVVEGQLKLTGGDPGEATLQVSLGDGRTLTSSVNVPRQADDPPELIHLEQGQTVSYPFPSGTTSFDSDVIAATGGGGLSIRGVAPGRATVHITRDGRAFTSIVEVAPTALGLPPNLELVDGERRELNVPEGARISVAGDSVVGVEADGAVIHVKAMRTGSTKVKVSAGVGAQERSQLITVDVLEPPERVGLKIGARKVVKVPGVDHVDNDDPDKVDLRIVGKDQVQLIGLDSGKAAIHAWPEAGNRRDFAVTVTK